MRIAKKKVIEEPKEEIVKVECAEGEDIEITEFPAQTTFNTEDMTITEEGE